MRLYLRMHLDAHYAVREAGNGEEALEILAKAGADAPDIVLADVMMPGMDGLELCRRMRAEPRWAALPVVLLSAKAQADQRVEGLRAGADDYVAKPFSVPELLQRLRVRLPRRAASTADARGRDEPTNWLAEVEACIDAKMGTPEFGVETLARAVGYSRRQLGRRLLELTGHTTESFILSRRLRRARELIEGGMVETRREAAHAVGLSPGYFARRYRQAGLADQPATRSTA